MGLRIFFGGQVRYESSTVKLSPSHKQCSHVLVCLQLTHEAGCTLFPADLLLIVRIIPLLSHLFPLGLLVHSPGYVHVLYAALNALLLAPL
jgi:hypothetical protein